MCWGWGASLERVVREGLSEEVTFKQVSEGSESARSRGKALRAQGTASAKALLFGGRSGRRVGAG